MELHDQFYMADILTPYGIAFRYPSELLEPDRFDADEAVKLEPATQRAEFSAMK